MSKKLTDIVSGADTDVAGIVSLAAAAESAQRPIVQINQGVPRLLIPNGETWKIQSLEKDLPVPARLTGTVQLASMASFISYVKTYKGDREVAVYSDEENTTATAVFDHHSDRETGWGGHRAVLKSTSDIRFKGWLENNNKMMSQAAFAEFLEDHLPEIVQPNAAALLAVITDLKVNTTVNTQHTKTLRNGNVSLVWDEKSTESTEVPTNFTVRVPLYSGSQKAYEFDARLRYRFQDRQLCWLFKIDQLTAVKQHGWRAEASQLAELETICPVFDGSPPAAVVAAE